MILREFRIKSIYQGALDKGTDLLEGLSAVLKQQNIPAGIISGIGAVSEARLAYYNHETRTYEEKIFSEPLEIVSLKGNISLKNGEIFLHLHAVLSRRDFSAIGGHVLPKTYVFAFEFEITPFSGQVFERGFDEATGLFLWKK